MIEENSKLIKIRITKNFTKKEREKYYQKILSSIDNIFIIDFECVANLFLSNNKEKSIFESNNFQKYNDKIPISFSILIKNKTLKTPLIFHENFMNEPTKIIKLWNDVILKNYNNEQVFVWGEDLEKEIIFNLIKFTSQKNLQKIINFTNWFDLQNLFLKKLWTDKKAIIQIEKTISLDTNKNNKISYETSLNNVKEVFEKYLTKKDLLLKHKRDRSFYQKINHEYFNIKHNPEKRIQNFNQELENYNNNDVLDINFILSNLNLFIQFLANNNNFKEIFE